MVSRDVQPGDVAALTRHGCEQPHPAGEREGEGDGKRVKKRRPSTATPRAGHKEGGVFFADLMNVVLLFTAFAGAGERDDTRLLRQCKARSCCAVTVGMGE